MGSIVLYIIEWAFALLVLLAIYKAAFSGTTLHRFNRFYLLGATLLSALLPLVHVTITDSTPAAGLSIEETEFARELSGTFTFAAEPQTMWADAPDLATSLPGPERKTSLWAVMLIGTYSIYVLTLIIGWSRGIIRARRFLRGKPRRRLSRTVWLVTHSEQYGPFSWMNYIVISDSENGFARRASLRHEYSHVKLLHSIDLVVLLACTIVNPVCWLVLQEIKIVHEYEADDEVINRYGIREQDYQRLLLIKAVGAEAYALASSFNLNIKKRIIMMNKNKTRRRRLMWLLLLIPMLVMTSVLFARSEKSLDINPLGITIGADNIDENTFCVKVVDENGKPVEGAMVVENPSQSFAVSFSFLGFTDKNGEFSFSTPDGKDFFSIAKEGYKAVKIRFENIDHDAAITLKKTTPGHEIETSDEHEIPAFLVKERNMMRVIVMKDGKVRVRNGVVDKTISLEKKSGLPKLTEIVKQFVANPKDDIRLPIIEDYDIPGFKTVNTTIRHMISLEREPDASLDTRDAAYGIIANAYYELRDEWCRKEFGKTYDECTQEQQGYSRAMYATKILASEMRYLCDVTIDVRKDALMAHVDRTDAKTGTPTDVRRAMDYGRILNDVEELEDYINNVVDASSRLRSVKVRFYPGGSTDIITDLKNMLRKKSAAIGIKYESVQDEDENSAFSVVSRVIRPGNTAHGNYYELCLDINENNMVAGIEERRDGENVILSWTVPQEFTNVDQLEKYIDNADKTGRHIRDVALNIRPDAKNGLVTDIKNSLRKKRLLNIRYVGSKTTGEDHRQFIYLIDIRNLENNPDNMEVLVKSLIAYMTSYNGDTDDLNSTEMKAFVDAYRAAQGETRALAKKYQDELSLLEQNPDMKIEDYEKIQQKYQEDMAELRKRADEMNLDLSDEYGNVLKSTVERYQYVCITHYKNTGITEMSADNLDSYLKDLSNGRIKGFTIPYSSSNYKLIQRNLSREYSDKAVLYLD